MAITPTQAQITALVNALIAVNSSGELPAVVQAMQAQAANLLAYGSTGIWDNSQWDNTNWAPAALSPLPYVIDTADLQNMDGQLKLIEANLQIMGALCTQIRALTGAGSGYNPNSQVSL